MNVNQLRRVMPHKTVMFSKADVKTSSLVDRDSVVSESCLKDCGQWRTFRLVMLSRLTVAVTGSVYHFAVRLGPKYLRHVLRRCQ